MNTHLKARLPRFSTLVAATALALGVLSPRVAESQQPDTFACYVPDVGAIYLIKLESLPDACLSESHVEIVLAAPATANYVRLSRNVPVTIFAGLEGAATSKVCSPEQRAVGGGGRVINGPVQLSMYASYPNATHQWQVRFRNPGASADFVIEVFVICMNP